MKNRKCAVVSKQRNLTCALMRKKTTTKEAGTWLVDTKTPIPQSSYNKRTCLLNAVTALFPLEKKELVHSAMVTDMPAEGDMSIFHIANALSNHGLSLEQVSDKYNQKVGASYHFSLRSVTNNQKPKTTT